MSPKIHLLEIQRKKEERRKEEKEGEREKAGEESELQVSTSSNSLPKKPLSTKAAPSRHEESNKTRLSKPKKDRVLNLIHEEIKFTSPLALSSTEANISVTVININ